MNNKPKKLLDQVREHICIRHLSMSTEETCCGWIRRYIPGGAKPNPNLAVPGVDSWSFEGGRVGVASAHSPFLFSQIWVYENPDIQVNATQIILHGKSDPCSVFDVWGYTQ